MSSDPTPEYVSTADRYDASGGRLLSCDVQFRNLGGRRRFDGPIATIRCLNDNSLVRDAVASPGGGRVLVIDGGGSLATALVGDKLAAKAAGNGWAGIVVHAAVRDTDALPDIEIGIKALGTNPRRSVKEGIGEVDVPVTFGGITFRPGDHLYSDSDGIVVSPADADDSSPVG